MKTNFHHPPNYFFSPTHPITVTLIGVGGNGSLMLSRLARMDYALRALEHPGIHVTAFDGDSVEPMNVGRQLFSPIDIGENKAVCAISKINHAFSLQWQGFPIPLEIPSKYLERNIIISCVDTPIIREQIGEWSKIERPLKDDLYRPFYWLDLGNGERFGQYVLGTLFASESEQKELPSITDLFPNLSDMDDEEFQGRGCSFWDKLSEQSLFINDTLASHASHCLFDLLAYKRISYHGGFLNLKKGKLNPISIGEC